jgi:hypothetical protein
MAKAKEISLGAKFGTVALKVNGICVEVSADGKNVKIISDTPVNITHAANINTPKTDTAIGAALKVMEIGDVAADGWYCIGKKADGSPLEMSPPVIMTHDEATNAQLGTTKRLPNSGELTQMYNALTSNPKALAAIAAGKIKGLDSRKHGSFPSGRVWGDDHDGKKALCLLSVDGYKNYYRLPDPRAEARFVR